MTRWAPQVTAHELLDADEEFMIFADTEEATYYLQQKRWPGFPERATCPRCGAEHEPAFIVSRPGLLRCRACRKQYTVRIGSIFEDSAIPLDDWVYAIWYLLEYNAERGSISHIAEACGFGYKTAWRLATVIRFAYGMKPPRMLVERTDPAPTALQAPPPEEPR